MRRFALLLLASAALLAACSKTMPTQPDNMPEETETETEISSLSEEQLLEIAAEKTELPDEVHLYDDLDYDGNAELLCVTKNADGLYETWFCSSDGTVCENIRLSEHEWDYASISTMKQNDGMHVFVSYRLAMGTFAHTDIIRLDDGYPTLVGESVHPIWCEDDRVVLMREDYDMTYDPALETTIGHTYKVTELEYDDGEYYEYAAVEVPLDDVKAMENSEMLFDQIETDENTPSKAYLRKNGIGYVECGDLDADREASRMGFYCYYTFAYEGERITGLIKGTFGSYDNAGRMTDHFGDFPVRE